MVALSSAMRSGDGVGKPAARERGAQRVAMVDRREREDPARVAERVEPAQAAEARGDLARAHRPRSLSQARLRSADCERVVERLAGRQHAVLLDHDPGVVAAGEQLLQAVVDARAAAAELAEHAGRPGLLHARALLVQTGEQIEVDVLEVHVVDELAGLAQERQRIAAAEGRVAGVEAEAEQAGVHPLEQRVELARRLDVAARMGVERRHEAALAAALGRAVRVVDEQPLAALAQPGLAMASMEPA